MGLSNARRALVIDSNPWNRRQICDVLGEFGYEVSACDSLTEGRKFFRSHPIVVAGTEATENEVGEFVDFVRSNAEARGAYLIRLGGNSADELELGFDDTIPPPFGREELDAKFRIADEWFISQSQQAVLLDEEPEVEIISSGPNIAATHLETLEKTQKVKTEEERISEAAEPEPEPATLADPEEETVMAEGAGAEPRQVKSATVSIRMGRGNGRPRDASGFESDSHDADDIGVGAVSGTTKYQYNLLIENAPLAMAMFDREMRYLIANSRWRAHFDLEGTPVVGRGHFDIFSEVSDRWQLLCDRARREVREVVGEEFVEWPDGTTDWVRWTMSPWQTEEGETGGLVVSCGVVTEEKANKGGGNEFEVGLADSLMKSGVTPIVILDLDGRVQRCNRIARHWGNWGDASGDDRLYWDAFVPESDRQRVREDFLKHSEAFEDDGGFSFPAVSIEPVTLADGDVRRVAWTNTARVGEGGVVTGLVRVGVEIRDEDLPTVEIPVSAELDEESISELQDEWMDSFPLMCWRTNSRGKIKFFNRQWLDFRGRNALEECDNGWMDGLHEEDYDSLIHAFDTAAKTGARVNHVARMLGGDGQYRWLRFVSARDFSDLEGASDGFIGYCEDLGRTIRLESELSAAKSRYDELLEDSTGAFRAKRALEDKITGLEEQVEGEKHRLAEERQAASASLAAELQRLEGERSEQAAQLVEEREQIRTEGANAVAEARVEAEQAVAQAREEHEKTLLQIREERGQALVELGASKDAQLEKALAEKEAELSERVAEKDAALHQAESNLAAVLKSKDTEVAEAGEKSRREVEGLHAEIEAKVADVEKVREDSRHEIDSLRSQLESRVADLEDERDSSAQLHVQGIADLEGNIGSLREELESVAAERLRLAGEIEAEKQNQQSREGELSNLRKEIDSLQRRTANAVDERERFFAIPENAPFGIALLGRDGAVLYSNPALDKLTGVEFAKYDAVENWLAEQGPSADEADQTKLIEVWRDGIWRQDGTKVLSMRTGAGLRELELTSKLLPEGQLLLSVSDRTDSIRAEEALRASEVKFRSIFYDSGVGMALVDKTGNIFDANPAQETLIGYSRAELRKMHIEDCLSLEEIDRKQQVLKEMAATKSRSGELTIKLLPKDNRPAWAHMNISLVRDPDGEVIFAAYFFHDITREREAMAKEAEAKTSLESTRAEKSAIVEASPDLIVVVGPDGMVESVVPPVRFPLQIDPAMEGRPIGEVIRPIATDYSRLATSAATSGGVETTPFSVNQGGEELHFECRIAKSGQENTVVVIRDVTSEKRAQEVTRRQALTFANIKDAIIVADLKGRINDWNPAAEGMFGYSREEAIGQGLYMLYDRDQPKRFKKTITTAISQHRKWEERTIFHHKDGSQGECEVTYVPLLDESGRPLALVGVSRIAPAEGAAPAGETAPAPPSGLTRVDLQDSSAVAKKANDRVTESLQSISDVLSLQESTSAAPETRGEIATSRARVESVALLHRVIAKGGDFERVDFGQYVRELVQFLLGEFGPEHAGIEVHLNVKGIILPVAEAQHLAVILFELLSNSLKHAFHRRASGVVGVSMGIGAEAGWMIVNDDGEGLPPGFRIDAVAHGIGLKIALEEARKIGGEIEVIDANDTEIQVGFRLNGAT